MSENQKPELAYKINKQWIGQSFANAARTYDNAAILQREVANRLFSRLEYIKLTPKSILDLGSGTGYCTDLLENRYKKTPIHSLDLSLGMLQYAKSKDSFFKKLRSRKSYLCGDAEQIPLKNEVCDMVFSSLALQWCFNLDKTFTDIKRVIEPGGLFMFSTLGPDTLRELRDSWKTIDSKHAHINAFIDMHDIGDALLRAGFSDPVMDVENITLTYSSVQSLMKDLKNLGSRNALQGRQVGLMGKQKLSAMINAYERFRKDDRLPATYEVVYGHAWVPEQGVRLSNIDNGFPIPVRSR